LVVTRGQVLVECLGILVAFVCITVMVLVWAAL
jgi:hypothetical protein